MQKEIITIKQAFKLYPRFNYFAQDKNGVQCLYAYKPDKHRYCWTNTGTMHSEYIILDKYDVLHFKKWYDSLTAKSDLIAEPGQTDTEKINSYIKKAKDCLIEIEKIIKEKENK